MSEQKNDARAEILGRIRRANANAGVTPRGREANRTDHPVSRATTLSRTEIVALFAETVEDYKAVVERCRDAEVAEHVAAALRGTDGVLVPEGFPGRWRAALADDALRADPGAPSGLDTIEAVLTTSAVGIARTGTIVLDHTAGQGRRALTLVPDLHVCVVRASDVHLDVAEALTALRPSVDAGHPLTWISGPSATSDIELARVEGVHGPRRLHVVIVDDA